MKRPWHIGTMIRFGISCVFVLAVAGVSHGQEREPVDAGAEPLPQGAVARIRPQGQPMGSPIRGLAVSPDGSQIAVFDPTSPADVTILDGRTGETSATIERPGASVVQQVAYSPDGRFAAAGTTQRGLLLWDTGNPRDRVQLSSRNPGRFVAAASSTAELGAEGELTGEISVGPLVVPELGVFGRLQQWQAHTGAVTGLRFSADGKRLASSGLDRIVAVWEPRSGKQLFKQMFDRQPLDCLALTGDGGKVAMVVDGELTIYEVDSGQKAIGADVAGDPVTAIEFTGDDKTIAVADGAGMLRTYDAETLKLAHETRAHRTSLTVLLAVPTENSIISGGNDGVVHIWDAATLQKGRSFYPNRSPIVDLALTSNGEYLGVATERLGGWCWRFDSPDKPLVPGWSIDLRLLALGFANEGRDLALITDRRLYLRASVAKPPPEAPRTFPPRRGPVQYFDSPGRPSGDSNGVAFSPDGKYAVANIGEGIGKWDVSTAVLRNVFPVEPNIAHAIAISPDGRWMAAGGLGIALWDLKEGKLAAKIGAHETNEVLSLVFSPDSRRLAAGGRLETHVWDVATRRKVQRVATGMVAIGHLGFTADGYCLVTFSSPPPPSGLSPGGIPKRASVWEIVSGGLRYRLGHHAPGLTSGFLANDRTTYYTGSEDGTIYRWDLGALIAEQEKPAEKPANLDQLWTDLASEDVRLAYRAISGLVAQKEHAVKHLAGSLEPESAAEHVDAWIADLGSPVLATRREASERLRRAGPIASQKLQQALAANPSPAVRARLEMLLALPADALSDEQIRGVRAVQVLERIGNDEARAVLDRLADGLSGAPVTQAAEAALAKLSQRAH
jgi:WD40 repeat protein